MKHNIKILAAVLAAFTSYGEAALGCRAEYSEQMTIPGLTAATSLNNHQYGVVRLAAATTVNIACEVVVPEALKMAIGVLQNKPYVNEPAQVCYMGLSKVFGGGTVTAGAPITYDSSGHVINAVSGSIVIGRALQTLATAGEIGTALILPPIRWGGAN